jgi:adenylate kinase family enzyme
MVKDNFKRIVVIGNCGSGKTYLAKKLAYFLSTIVIHLDDLFWEPGRYDLKRPKDIVNSEIENLSKEEFWIMEGVFGDLAHQALKRATHLIFLDKDWKECEAALIERGPQPYKFTNSNDAHKSFQDLLVWANKYESRETMSSLKGHTKLFDEFTGWKQRLTNREETEKFEEYLKIF